MSTAHTRITDTGPHTIVRSIPSPSASIAPALWGIKRRATLSLNSLLLGGALLLGGLAMGMLISTQSQGNAVASALSPPATSANDVRVVNSTISRLEADQASLTNRIATLRTQLSNAQANDASRKATLLDTGNQLAGQRLSSGAVAVQGPGIVASYDDSADRSIPENEDPANYILHEYDLRDVVNTLWIAGAEAVSINGERIVDTTSIYCVGTTIIVNTTRLSPPYEVRAIGDPNALAAGLKNSTQMQKFNQRARIYDLPVKIESAQRVEVPAYSGSFAFKYARSPEQK